MKEPSVRDGQQNRQAASRALGPRAQGGLACILTGAQWHEMSWVEVVEQHEIKKYGDSEENLLAIEAQKKLAHEVHSLSLIFSDCDAGGGFSQIHKMVIQQTLKAMIKCLTLTYSFCRVLGDDPDLREDLKNKKQTSEQFSFFVRANLTDRQYLDEIAQMFYFVTDSLNIIRIFNDGASTQSVSHCCLSHGLNRNNMHGQYNPSCRYQADSRASSIYIHEAVFHPLNPWYERVYALYKKIAYRQCGRDNISAQIFADVLNYYKDSLLFSDIS